MINDDDILYEEDNYVTVPLDEDTEDEIVRFYRYESPLGYNSNKLSLRKFRSIKETPKGHWIVPENSFHIYTELNMNKKKWISKDGVKRFAYPTKEEALYSFQRRKIAQLKILANQIHRTRTALRIANDQSLTKFTLDDDFYKHELRLSNDFKDSRFRSTSKTIDNPIFRPNHLGKMGFLTVEEMNL